MIPGTLKAVLLTLAAVAVVIVLAAPQAAPWDSRVYREVRALDGQLIATPMPPMTVTTLDGQPFDLAALRGQVVFLNLWATWCQPCRDEIPSMMALARTLAGEHARFEMVALSWDEDLESVHSFLAEFPELGQRATILLDPGGTRSRVLGTRLLPETYVIDADGQIVARFQSLRDWNSASSQRLMTALIRQK